MFALLAACHQLVPINEEQIMQDILNAYISGQLPPADLTITYHIGDDFSGETFLELHGDGTYTLWSTSTSGRQRRDYNGQIEQTAVQELVREMIDQRIWEAKHVRSKPREDDPPVSIQVISPADRAEVSLWISEVQQVSAFASIQNSLLSLIRAMSSNEILESGR